MCRTVWKGATQQEKGGGTHDMTSPSALVWNEAQKEFRLQTLVEAKESFNADSEVCLLAAWRRGPLQLLYFSLRDQTE